MSTVRSLVSLIPHLRSSWRLFVLSTFVTIGSSTTLALVSLVSVWVSSQFFLDPSRVAAPWLWLLFGCVCAHGVSVLLEMWWSHELAYKVLHDLRNQVYRAINRIAPLGLKGKKTADVASIAMSDIEQLEWFYAHTAGVAINAVVSPILILFGVSLLSSPFVFIMVVPLVGMIAVALLLLPLQQRQGQLVRTQLSRLRQLSLESVHGQQELISLGLTARHNERIKEATLRVQKTRRAQIFRQAIETASSGFFLAAGTIVLLVLGHRLVADGHMSAVILPVLLVGASVSTAPVLVLLTMIGRCGEIGSSASRLNSLVQAPDPIHVRDDVAGTVSSADLLSFEHVDFSYDDSQQVLADFALSVKPNEIVGIVGASGAGKTTVARLALRFIDPCAGRVCINGADIRQFDPDEYRENIALVPQESYVFAGTVAENLRIAAPDATDEQCWAALESAELAAKVRDIGGLEAHVDKSALSGGEKQRLGIARAFIRRCPLVLLDEPLANLDPRLEHSIAGQLRRLCADRTVMIIAHRLHTIAIADRIVLLKDGSVLASGSYEQMRTHPEFIRLFARQLDAE